jgi:hypothetical protein
MERHSTQAGPDARFVFHQRLTYALYRKHYKHDLKSWRGAIARIKSFYWYVLRGYKYEVCDDCGAKIGVVWTALDKDWMEIVGHPGGLLCVHCFDRELRDRGEFVRWVPVRGPESELLALTRDQLEAIGTCIDLVAQQSTVYEVYGGVNLRQAVAEARRGIG